MTDVFWFLAGLGVFSTGFGIGAYFITRGMTAAVEAL